VNVLVIHLLSNCMNNTKKIEYASVKVTSTYPCVEDGQIYFTQESNTFVLEDFEVPDFVNNEEELDHYLNELLNESGSDIASVGNVFILDSSEV